MEQRNKNKTDTENYRGMAKCTYFIFKNQKLWPFFFFNSYYKLKEFLCEQDNIIVYTTVIKALYISLG